MTFNVRRPQNIKSGIYQLPLIRSYLDFILNLKMKNTSAFWKPWLIFHRGNSEEILEEISSVALLSPACSQLIINNIKQEYLNLMRKIKISKFVGHMWCFMTNHVCWPPASLSGHVWLFWGARKRMEKICQTKSNLQKIIQEKPWENIMRGCWDNFQSFTIDQNQMEI